MLCFSIFGFGVEVGVGTYAMELQKFIYSYEYFKTVHSKTYYALNTSTRAVNNSSALLLIFVLVPFALFVHSKTSFGIK